MCAVPDSVVAAEGVKFKSQKQLPPLTSGVLVLQVFPLAATPKSVPFGPENVTGVNVSEPGPEYFTVTFFAAAVEPTVMVPKLSAVGLAVPIVPVTLKDTN